MRRTALRLVLLPLLLASTHAWGEEGGALLFLGLNEQGAETWWRARDEAVVIRVPGGEYLKRPYEGWEATEEPEPVSVASFFVDQHEVTNDQFARFLDAAGAEALGLLRKDVPGLVRGADGRWTAAPGLGRHPVTAATGAGALAYAAWVGGRLPTADEWEKAAGGPGGRTYPWGEEAPDATRANFGRPSARGLAPVGSYATGASAYGALDMAGNAYERVMTRVPSGERLPVMLKGGSWLSPHPLNLRVMDMCMQPMQAAERSVGFRCVMDDPEPDRAPRRAAAAPALRLAPSLDEAVAEARRRHVPIFLVLLYDSCGQCDRLRAETFTDPRFVAYCNEHLVMAVGHQPGDAFEDPHPAGEDDACPLYPGLTCRQHEILFGQGLAVVGSFVVSPGCFVLDPERVAAGAGAGAVLVGERAFPKWGAAVDAYLAAFDRARALLGGAGGNPGPR